MTILLPFPPRREAKYCDEDVHLFVCLSWSVCPLAYLENYMAKLYQIFCAC